MSRANNPYTVGFGRVPSHYINRDLVIDDIISNISDEPAQGQAYKITGIRGTGKTVTLTALERKPRKGLKNKGIEGEAPQLLFQTNTRGKN